MVGETLTFEFKIERRQGVCGYVLKIMNKMDCLTRDYEPLVLSPKEAESLADLMYPLTSKASRTQPFGQDPIVVFKETENVIVTHDLKRLEEKVDILYKMVHNHEETIIESPLYDLCKRVKALESEQDIHTQHLKKLDVQWDNFSKLVVDWMKTTGGDVETLKEEFGLMKFIECYARGRKTLDDLQNGKDATKQP